jgi:DNA-binding NarL/FixJ family response regulator
MNPKILIVDDHEVVRQGVRSILSKSRPDWEVCGEASGGKEAIRAAIASIPDIVVLDITMPGMSGLEAAAHIVKLGLPCRVLIFTMHESETLIGDVRAVGAHGYVQKSQASRDLVLAIESLLAGGTFFAPTLQAEPKKKREPKSGTTFSKPLYAFLSLCPG